MDKYKKSKSTVMKQGGRKRKAAKDVVEDGQFDIWKYRSKIAEILAMPIVEVRTELAKQQPHLEERQAKESAYSLIQLN